MNDEPTNDEQIFGSALVNTVEKRSVRGRERGANEVWRQAQSHADSFEACVPEPKQDVGAIHDFDSLDRRSTRTAATRRSSWFAAAAVVLIVAGLGLASMVGRPSPARSVVLADGLVVHDSVSPTPGALDVEPTTLLSSEVGDMQLSTSPNIPLDDLPIVELQTIDVDGKTVLVLRDLGDRDRIIEIGDLAPPSLACDRAVAAEGRSDFSAPEPCLERPRQVTGERIVDIGDREVRLVERTHGDLTQTTAIFADREDVVRLVGDCELLCMERLASVFLNEEEADATDWWGRDAARLLGGVAMLLLAVALLGSLVVNRRNVRSRAMSVPPDATSGPTGAGGPQDRRP